MANKVVRLVAGLGATSVIAVSGAALASSQTTNASNQQAQHHQIRHHHGGRHGAPLTGATLKSVTDAIKAKDSAVVVKVAFKKADGSYEALGTKAGKPVHVAVSKDLKSVVVKPGGRHAGRGAEAMRHRGTPVKGAELAKVETAIKAKDSSITVERVFQGPKGAFHAMGTQGGKRVHIKVSKDLKTVTVKAAGARHGHGPHHPGAQAPAGSAAASA